MGQTSKKTNMRAVIFAGGVGTRMWPLSRSQTPKQFEKIVGDKSTLQLTIDRIRPDFDWHNIYISTGIQYKKIIEKQLPQIPAINIIGEPVMRDVAGAVGYLSAILAKSAPDDPFVILWSDHLMEKVAEFKKVLAIGGEYIRENKRKFLFIGQKPRFASQNLGWIEMGRSIKKLNGLHIHKFKSWKYRPEIQLARQFFTSGHHVWNPGYWIVAPGFVLEQYEKFMPTMYKKLLTLQESYGSKGHEKILEEIYHTFEKISFDDAILEKLEPDKAVVLPADFGWSDIGTWQALKEALQKSKTGNVVMGENYLENSQDCLVYNTDKKLLVGVDLTGMVIVNTKDVLMICPQESMKSVKKVVNDFKANSKYKKFT
ncbi:mannose-1-phosphate guanylyltransferase [Patescibacteria group bacterium]